MTATEAVDLQAAVAQECDALADVLDAGGADLWDARSLCAGWRVREVVAHLTMPARYSTASFLLQLVRRGGFQRASDRIATTDAGLQPEQLLCGLRSDRLKAWQPPGGSRAGALVHLVVHGLDITVPSGIARPLRATTMTCVLDTLTQPRSLRHFGVDLTGVSLQASDLDWVCGAGPVVRGAAHDLALALAGRRVGDRLDGDVPWL